MSTTIMFQGRQLSFPYRRLASTGRSLRTRREPRKIVPSAHNKDVGDRTEVPTFASITGQASRIADVERPQPRSILGVEAEKAFTASDGSSLGRPSFLQQKAQSVLREQVQKRARLSGMTPSERAVFAGMWTDSRVAASTPRTQTQEATGMNHSDTDARKILNLFTPIPENSRPADNSFSLEVGRRASDLRTVFDGSEKRVPHEEQSVDLLQETGTDSREAGLPPLASQHQNANIEQAARDVVLHVAERLEQALRSPTARSDVAMWEVCEDEIFHLIKLVIPPKLSLTSSPAPAPTPASITQTPVSENNGYHRPLSVNEAQESSPRYRHPLIAPSIPLVPLLSRIYPALLLLALRLFLSHHPTSPYALALLPTLKRLGPISYVLGTNTHFYNALLSLRWNVYSDLKSLDDLMGDMERNGVEFDQGTWNLMKKIVEERNSDLEPISAQEEWKGGDSSSRGIDIATATTRGRGFWMRPHVQKWYQRVCVEWKAVVAKSLEERGLGEVMREIGEGVGGFGDERWDSRDAQETAVIL